MASLIGKGGSSIGDRGFLPYPRDLRAKAIGRLGDPILLFNGLSLPGSMDDRTYGTASARTRAALMPYTDQGGFVTRSLGQDTSETPWYKTPLAAAGLGFAAGALLCAVLKR